MKTHYTVALAMLAGVGLGAIAVQGLHAQAKPSAYVVTEVEIINQEVFKEFAPKVADLNRAAGAKYLARGENIVALDGQPPKRVTITVFESVEKARALRTSAAWKELTPMREKATKTRSYIVEGVAN